MPVKIPKKLPAASTLTRENIFFMESDRAHHQDIRPLRIAILNLMPTKEATETQLLRLLGNTSLQIEPVFLCTASYTPRHTTPDYIEEFYTTFEKAKKQKFDGLIVTGAPVELMEFEQVIYWNELKEIMEWANNHVYSSFYICWAAQAALYYNYGIRKHMLDEKLSGVYNHRVSVSNAKLLRGFDDAFNAPHSRNTTVYKEDILACDNLEILAESEEAGVYLVASRDGRRIFVTGHSEYDWDTLHKEFIRDLNKGINPAIPNNYYPADDYQKPPCVSWRAHANLLYGNWLNYYVYQETPFDIALIDGAKKQD